MENPCARLRNHQKHSQRRNSPVTTGRLENQSHGKGPRTKADGGSRRKKVPLPASSQGGSRGSQTEEGRPPWRINGRRPPERSVPLPKGGTGGLNQASGRPARPTGLRQDEWYANNKGGWTYKGSSGKAGKGKGKGKGSDPPFLGKCVVEYLTHGQPQGAALPAFAKDAETGTSPRPSPKHQP